MQKILELINIVELCTKSRHNSPCKYGSIVDNYACYCYSSKDETPRKCHIWHAYGEGDLSKWKKGNWGEGCPYYAKISQ